MPTPRSPPPMASALAKKTGLKVFEKHLQRYEPVDPLYEIYTDNKGRQKRRKVSYAHLPPHWAVSHPHHQSDRKLSCLQREIPPGLSKRDARILKSVKKRAHYLDTGLNVCGFKIGWTFFVGTLPETNLLMFNQTCN